MGITAERLSDAMARRAISQSELARSIGATQGAINKIVLGRTSNSRLLPRLATVLGVPLPWLLGQSDDLDTGAPRTPMSRLQHVTLAVALPSTPALAEAFGAILKASRDMSEDELARELARRLPIVLRAAASGALSQAPADDDELDEPDEDQATALPPARRAAGR